MDPDNRTAIAPVVAVPGSPGAGPAAVMGSSGFIGSRLTAALIAAGVQTASFPRDVPFTHQGRLAPGLLQARTIYVVATTVNPTLAELHPERGANDLATLFHLLELVGRAGHRPVVVLASSGGAVYDTRLAPPYDEETPTSQTSAYGRVKLSLEQELLSRTDAVRPVVLRLANVFGPHQPTGQGLGVIAHWLQAAAAGDPVQVLGDPSTIARDFVYLDDTVEAMLRVRAVTGQGSDPAFPMVINIGSGRATSLADLLSVVANVTGRRLTVQRQERRSFDRSQVWLDVDRARRVLGWRARTPLSAGVRASWQALIDGSGPAVAPAEQSHSTADGVSGGSDSELSRSEA